MTAMITFTCPLVWWFDCWFFPLPMWPFSKRCLFRFHLSLRIQFPQPLRRLYLSRHFYCSGYCLYACSCWWRCRWGLVVTSEVAGVSDHSVRCSGEAGWRWRWVVGGCCCRHLVPRWLRWRSWQRWEVEVAASGGAHEAPDHSGVKLWWTPRGTGST